MHPLFMIDHRMERTMREAAMEFNNCRETYRNSNDVVLALRAPHLAGLLRPTSSLKHQTTHRGDQILGGQSGPLRRRARCALLLHRRGARQDTTGDERSQAAACDECSRAVAGDEPRRHQSTGG
jgi:hypothetical protein